MAPRKQPPVRIRLRETAGDDAEAVARALQTWAILLADQVQRQVVEELRRETGEAEQADKK